MRYIGIDLGGTNIAAGLVNEDGVISARASLPTLAGRDPREIVRDMAKVTLEIVEKSGMSLSDVNFIGIASPGAVDTKAGMVRYSSNLKIRDLPMVAMMKELTGVEEISVVNDANAAAKGEAEVGAAKGFSDSVMITLGTGVGGGIIIDRKILSGFNGIAGEIGHTVIVKGGRPCGCGRRGCFEKYGSATGLILTTKERMAENKNSIMWDMVGGDVDKVNGRTSFDAMREGDACGIAVVNEYIDHLADGITNISNILAPEVISIGGGISNEGDTLLLPLRERISTDTYAARSGVANTEIRIAKLKNDAGIIGAAMLGKNYE